MHCIEPSSGSRGVAGIVRLRHALLVSLLVAVVTGCGTAGRSPASPGLSAESALPSAVAVADRSTTPATEPPSTPEPTTTPTVTPPAPVAAVVNGDYVFLADYERRLADFEQALLAQGLDPESEEGSAQLEQLRHDVLESLIDFLLIEQAAPALGVSLGAEELETLAETDIAAGGGAEAFQEWLEATGQTREDFREALRQAVLSQRVMEAVTEGVASEPEQVHLRHIVVDTEQEAREIRRLLSEGADFRVLAQERSLDMATREEGGDLGWFPRGLLAPEMEALAFGLAVGSTSDVFQLGEGFHIIEVLERELARPLSTDMEIEYRLALFEGWLAEQRDAAAIERLVDDGVSTP